MSKKNLKWVGLILIITGLTSFSHHPELGYMALGIGTVILLAAALFIRDKKENKQQV